MRDGFFRKVPSLRDKFNHFYPSLGDFYTLYYQMSSCQTWQKTQVWHELNLQFQEFGKLPNYDAGGNADIQGMLGAELRNLQAAIAHIYDVLLDSLQIGRAHV